MSRGEGRQELANCWQGRKRGCELLKRIDEDSLEFGEPLRGKQMSLVLLLRRSAFASLCPASSLSRSDYKYLCLAFFFPCSDFISPCSACFFPCSDYIFPCLACFFPFVRLNHT